MNIKKDIIYKMQNDQNIPKSKMVESIFIEISNPDKKDLIAGCLYQHLCMKVNEFNNDFVSYLSGKTSSRKKKEISLMAGFNVGLLKYETDTNNADFLNKIYLTSLIPQIKSPTRVTPRSKILIYKMFSTA